ncbi:helix-turn-helix domain-containing protein [Roseibium sp.]|uniref:helix-turn-helix domain-containing protein n=1 Tax=Roseibium sp. TaxID=1936156 RepID=UPI003D09A8FF
MARPESEPESEIGKRLRLLRKTLGGHDVKAFADKLGIGKATLYNYEKGDREPTSRVLTALSEVFGANVHWILTGAGEMFADASVVPSGSSFHTIKPDVFRAVGRLVTKLHKTEGITLPSDALYDEQSSAYNALIERAEDPSDEGELTSLLPWLETRLKRQLAAAKASPGTGKREA